MRCLEINKKKFYYCNFDKMIDVVDEYDNKTGEKIISYESPKEYYANISTNKGDSQLEFFGNFNDYDKVIVADDPNWDIDENSVLFIDKEVSYDSLGIPQYDYIVTKKAPSLNGIAIAIKRVE